MSASDPNVDVPLRRLTGRGVYRRRYRLIAEANRVSAELEDDFHAFAATLEHDGERVTAVDGEARRVPWSTCPGALRPLAALWGAPLDRDVEAIAARVDARTQCTHWFDAACLGVAHAAARRGKRVYDVAVEEPWEGLRSAEVRVDGELALAWEIERTVIRSEGRLASTSLVGSAFRDALASIADPDEREAAWVLRKGVLISFARLYDMDRVSRPAAFGVGIGASCHTFQPAVSQKVHRMVGATRDFTDAPDALAERLP